MVLDASAVVEVLTGARPDPALLDRIEGADALYAPHLIDAEAVHALRGLARGGVIGEDAAAEARRGLQNLGIIRYPHTGLVERVWELRHSFTAYDALYVALAETLEVPLVTADAKLTRGSGHQAEIDLYPAP